MRPAERKAYMSGWEASGGVGRWYGSKRGGRSPRDSTTGNLHGCVLRAGNRDLQYVNLVQNAGRHGLTVEEWCLHDND